MQNFWNKEKIILLLIILLGAFLRLYNLNWDQGYHLHPDERAITMFTLPLNFPTSISEFLSTTSPLNPHFFAYGSLPMYLLKAVAVILTPFYPLAVLMIILIYSVVFSLLFSIRELSYLSFYWGENYFQNK